METLEKAHYTCLCIMCNRLVEFPLCTGCSEEADQLDKEELQREWKLRQKAAEINRKEGLR